MSEVQILKEIARETGVPEVSHPASHARVAEPPPGYDPYWDGPLWGMGPICKEINRSLPTGYRMNREGDLKGYVTKVAGQFVSTRRKLRALINGVPAGA
jgi:hypothetical protein